MGKINECPVCKNKIGFVFGTCCNCGFNSETNQFKNIRVPVELLEYLISKENLHFLIKKHLENYLKED